MKNNDKKREFEVGDKVVINDEGKKYYEDHYWDEDMESLEGSVYAVVVNATQEYMQHILVDWVNHKGMVIRYRWYMLKKYAELYEDVPRET